MANMMDFWRKVWKSVGDYSYIVDSEATRKKQHPVSYVFPVKNNFGEKNGECVYKSLEECCRSMGELKYDEKYWIELKGTDIINPEGVLFHELSGYIASSGVFGVTRMLPPEGVIQAYNNNWRVLICKDNHMAVVKEMKLWSDKSYQIIVAETSPEPQFDSKELKRKASDLVNYPFFSFYKTKL